MGFTTLGELLEDPERFDWAEMLYLPAPPWQAATRALVAPTDDLPADQPIPPEAISAGLNEIVPIATVQDIVENLRAQGAQGSASERLKAFHHYIEHDAFVNVEAL